jgi:diacylglycerol O-acyltransferase
MVERLSRLDASFLYLEEPGTPMHVGGLLVLDTPPGGVDALAALVEARLPLVPRYRQRVVEVPGQLANPVWVDDPEFNIDYHVRRSGLPRPGTEAQLLDLVSRLTSRPLDRKRPLWEVYLVEGLADGRVAVITKTHPALVDGLSAIDIGQVLLDVAPDAPALEPAPWKPRRPPGGAELVLQALDEYRRRPRRRWRPRGRRSPTSGPPPPGWAGSPEGCCAPRGRPCSRRRTAHSTRRSGGSGGWHWHGRSWATSKRSARPTAAR